jgi:hypothetical protein
MTRAAITLANAEPVPTERSNSLPRIAKVMPNEAMARIDAWSKMLTRLPLVRKTGLVRER